MLHWLFKNRVVKKQNFSITGNCIYVNAALYFVTVVFFTFPAIYLHDNVLASPRQYITCFKPHDKTAIEFKQRSTSAGQINQQGS